MRRDHHADEEIAGAAARAGKPLPLQPDLLTLGETGRNVDLHFLAGRQLHALLRARSGFGQRNRQRGRDIAAGCRRNIFLLELKAAAPPTPSASHAAEHVLEDVLETAAATAAKAAAATAAALEATRPIAEGFERALAVGASARPGAEACETLETRLACGVGLAPIESFALFRVADDLVGG